MIKPVGFLLILSLVGYAFSSSKPVSIRDKATGQLVTSSLLTWESFNSKGDIKQQFENAIAGGNFTGADVRFSSTKKSVVSKYSNISSFTFRKNLFTYADLQ